VNSIISITKEFRFEMAHALHGHRGKCAQIHGHSYRLEVTVKGTPINDPSRPDHGMVMDFAELKAIVKEHILDRFDHALLLSERDRHVFPDAGGLFKQLEFTSFQPTCENLMLEMVRLLNHYLPPDVTIGRLRLYETATSYAEWEGF
jgi:6-pyruvoyltetrahydropterin/6-carboxytetrahydropterin synthase